MSFTANATNTLTDYARTGLSGAVSILKTPAYSHIAALTLTAGVAITAIATGAELMGGIPGIGLGSALRTPSPESVVKGIQNGIQTTKQKLYYVALATILTGWALYNTNRYVPTTNSHIIEAARSVTTSFLKRGGMEAIWLGFDFGPAVYVVNEGVSHITNSKIAESMKEIPEDNRTPISVGLATIISVVKSISVPLAKVAFLGAVVSCAQKAVADSVARARENL